MGTINSIYAEIKNMETAINAKGGEVIKANSSPSLSEIVNGIYSINSFPKEPVYNTQAVKVIITAELPNMTLNLKTSEGEIVDTKTTGSDGGKVELNTIDPGIYIVEAFNTDNEKIWDTEVEIEADKNTYYVKSGKKFNDYSWAEIKQASNGNYAKYMWTEGDKKILREWMGCDLSNCPNDVDVSTSKHYVYIVSFDHDIKVKDGKKAGITLSTSSYRYGGYNDTYCGSYTGSVTSSSYFTNKSNAQNYAGNSYHINAIYQSNANYIGNYWAHVYEAQHNPDTTNTYEWFLDGSVLDKSYLPIPTLMFYNNGGPSTYTSTTYTEAKTHASILYWRDWLFSGLPYISTSAASKVYPDTDACSYSSYYGLHNYSNGTSYHRDYNTCSYKVNWLTGVPRLYSLPKGSEFYISPKDPVTASTVGTYYLYDYSTMSYQPVTLPDQYNSSYQTRYLQKITLVDDGPILKCFPEELREIMEKVRKTTVAPYFDSNENLTLDPLAIQTEDYIYVPSAYELYGHMFDNHSNIDRWGEDKAFIDLKGAQTVALYGFSEQLEGDAFINYFSKKALYPSLGFSNNVSTRTDKYHGYVNINAEAVVTSKVVNNYTPIAPRLGLTRIWLQPYFDTSGYGYHGTLNSVSWKDSTGASRSKTVPDAFVYSSAYSYDLYRNYNAYYNYNSTCLINDVKNKIRVQNNGASSNNGTVVFTNGFMYCFAI